MHVHDLNPWRTLIAMGAFVLLLAIGFITMHEPIMSYELDMKQSVEILNDSTNFFTPNELDEVLKQQPTDIVLIDIRDRFSFGQGHIPGSKNITAFELSQEESIELMSQYKNEGITVVLIGSDQLEVNGPWMVGRQVGYDNIKILLGGYNYYKEHINKNSADPNDKSYLMEIARYDYAKLANDTSDDSYSTSSKTKKPILIQRKKKTRVASGGC